MTLKDYVYMSTAKINALFPQIPRRLLDYADVKAGLNVGIIKTEIQTRKKQLTREDKMQRVLSYLDDNREIGTISKPKRYFRGEIEARSLIYGDFVFFGGINELKSYSVYVGLACSLKHMIGYDYRKVTKNEFSFVESQVPIGSAEAEIFSKTSDNVAFSWELNRICDRHDALREVKYLLEKEREQRLVKLRLTEEDRNLIATSLWSNKLMRWIAKRELKWIIFDLLTPVPKFLLRMLLGADKYEAKMSAIKKERELKNEMEQEEILDNQDQELLKSVYSACHIDSPKNPYEFVALTILDGKISGDKRIILGSPIYLAKVPKVPRMERLTIDQWCCDEIGELDKLGYSAKHIAKVLNISQDTVAEVLSEIRKSDD